MRLEKWLDHGMNIMLVMQNPPSPRETEYFRC